MLFFSNFKPQNLVSSSLQMTYFSFVKCSNFSPNGPQFFGKQANKQLPAVGTQREVKENGGLDGRAVSSISSNVGDVVERQGNELGKALH